jgi:hypothetical protein
MSSNRFQKLLKKFLFNLRRHSTLYGLPLWSKQKRNGVIELRGEADDLFRPKIMIFELAYNWLYTWYWNDSGLPKLIWDVQSILT